jgi:protein-L-isoaspartate(D-aspartate) O-methyltransferase
MAFSPLIESLRSRGIADERVLQAMARLDRSRFVPPEITHEAEWDTALPIGHAQTISQPYVVAYMTQALQLEGNERVLEIGTGSGYQTAVLASLCREVYSIEIVAPLAERASALLLGELGLGNVRLRQGDGHRGWPEAVPFDAILLTAAPQRLPPSLLGQLAEGGRLVAPVGPTLGEQEVVRVRRTDGDVEVERLLPVRFVPMTSATLPQ